MTNRISAFSALAITFATLASSANAQCSRPGFRPYTPPGHTVHIHQVTHRPVIRTVSTYNNISSLPVSPTCSVFGGCRHVDDYAVRLQVIMHELCMDMYFNYSHNPNFQAAYTDAYTLYQMAKRIHDTAHVGNFDSMRARLAGADHLFHELKCLSDGWSRNPRRQVGTLGMIAKLEMADDTLHNLMRDLGVNAAPQLAEPPTPGQIGLPTVPPPPAGFDGPGLPAAPISFRN